MISNLKYNINERREILELLNEAEIIDYIEYEILKLIFFKIGYTQETIFSNYERKFYNLIENENSIKNKENYFQLNKDYKFYNEFYNKNIEDPYTEIYYIHLNNIMELKRITKDLILSILNYNPY